MDNELKKELKSIEKKKQKARSLGDKAEEAKLCNIAGELLAQHRLFEDAVEEHKLELQLSAAINDKIGIAIAHRKIGECLCEAEDYENSLTHQQKYLDLSKKANNLVEEQRAYATIGRTWFQSAKSSSDMMKAQAAFLESLSICDQLREIVKEKELLEMRARLYLNLGLVYHNLNSKMKGRKSIEKALAIAVNQSLKDTEYRCNFSLGEIKMSEGRPSEALQYFEKARKVSQHQKKKFDEADTLVQMGQVLLSLGDFRGGKNILKQCLKSMGRGNHLKELRTSLLKAIKGTRLLEKTKKCSGKNDELIKVYEDLGDIFTQVRCYSKAIYYYHKQLELGEQLEKCNQDIAVICVSLAASYGDNKQYDKAKEYFFKELQLREEDPSEQSDTWCNIAQVRETCEDDYEDIKEAYMSGIKCAKIAQNLGKQIRLLSLLSDVQRKFSQKRDLEKTLNEISSLEEIKMEEDSESQEDEDGSQMDDEDEEGDLLIEEEMTMSDEESDDEEEGSQPAVGKVKRTKSKSINKRNEKGETILHCAAIRGDFILAKSSIEKGVSVHSRDYCGWQPLHEACNHGNIDIVELLIDHGADVNDPGGPHCRGMTPLHDATLNGHVNVVKLLIERGASVTKKNKEGKTPLDQVSEAIADNDSDEDDSPDPELSETLQNLEIILRKAMSLDKEVVTTQGSEPPPFSEDAFSELSDDYPSSFPSSPIEPLESTQDEIVPSSHSFSRRDNTTQHDSSKHFKAPRKSPYNTGQHDNSTNSKAPKTARDNTIPDNISWNSKALRKSPNNTVQHDNSRNSKASKTTRDNTVQDNISWNSKALKATRDNTVQHDSSRNSKTPIETYDAFHRNTKQHSWNRNAVMVLPDSPPKSKASAKFIDSFQRHTERPTWDHDRPFAPKRNMMLKLPSKNPGTFDLSNKPSEKEPRNLDRSSALGHHRSTHSLSKSSKALISVLDPLTGSTDQDSRNLDAPALIPEEEYLEGIAAADGWLIDDLPKKSGKRKRSSDIRTMFEPSETPHSSSATRMSNSSSRSAKKTRSRLKQSRLNVVSGQSMDDDWDDRGSVGSFGSDPAGSPITIHDRFSTRNHVPVPTCLRLRVKVKDKVFLIPCPTNEEKKTVAWLAEQATTRYYTACGLKPALLLATTEGAALSPDDYVTDVLSNNEEVMATVESWDLPPLTERYRSACLSTNTDIYQPVVEVLEANTYLSNFDFSDLALTPVTLLPLFRALQCHEQLVRLSLPGNRMGDTGFHHLVAAIPCFPNLAALAVNCNGITHKGLRHLASALNDDTQTSEIWMGLKELDISFNHLKDISASSLSTILRSCLLLQKLNIQSCSFTGATFQLRSVVIEALAGLTRLRHFNISHNDISSEGLRHLLNALSSSPLQVLDVSYTTERYSPTFGKALGDHLDTEDCCIQELNCQGCILNDITPLVRSRCFLRHIVKLDLSLNEIGQEGCKELITAIPSCQALKHLNLSGNLKIYNSNLRQFLSPSVTKCIQRLDLSVCGLTSPLPIIELENLQTTTRARMLQYLNLSHNSIHRNDQEKLADWWTSKWGSQSKINLQSPFIIFTINELTS